MNHRTTTLFASIVAVGLASGCAMQVKLKGPSRFSQKQIRRIPVTDACQLQVWFETKPAPNKLLTQVGTAYKGKDGFTQEHGTTSYQITDSRQQGMFLILLARFYRTIPTIAMRNSFVVAVDFHRVKGKVRMPHDTPIRLHAAGRTTHLTYHPCIAEYLLNRDHYAARANYVVSTVIPGSAE